MLLLHHVHPRVHVLHHLHLTVHPSHPIHGRVHHIGVHVVDIVPLHHPVVLLLHSIVIHSHHVRHASHGTGPQVVVIHHGLALPCAGGVPRVVLVYQ